MSRAAAATLALLGAAAPGCVYYNAMWSAERFATQARHSEARGEENAARGLWLQAAVKAESVLTRHPRSRWADDALVLRLEALVRGGNCASAAAYIPRARGASLQPALSERADLAAAQCALEAGRPSEAGAQLAAPLRSADARVWSRAALLAGRAAWDRGDAATAIGHYATSTEPSAGPARVRALLGTGRGGEARALLDSLSTLRLDAEEWLALYADVAQGVGAEPASGALDRLLARARLPLATRQRLLLADGDRLLAAGAVAPALVRYRVVAATDAVGVEGSLARVRMLVAAATQAESLEALAPLGAAARRLVSATPGGPAAIETRAFLGLLDQLGAARSEAAEFRAAELARDSLRAGTLAGRLFVEFARRRPASLFAPKALVAALPLAPALADSLKTVLEGDYAASPYTLALRGEISPAYAAAEDSMAQDLGVQLRDAGVAYRSTQAPPVPGARGPWLDQVFRSVAGHAAPPPSPALEPDFRVRPRPAPPPPPRPGQRPPSRGERP